jgi:hypothetical protein
VVERFIVPVFVILGLKTSPRRRRDDQGMMSRCGIEPSQAAFWTNQVRKSSLTPSHFTRSARSWLLGWVPGFARLSESRRAYDLPERQSDFSAAPALLCQLSPVRGIAEIGKFARHCRKPGDLCLTDGGFSAVTNGQWTSLF